MDLIERGDTMKPEAREKIDALMKRFADEERRYADEKKEIERAAKALEHERDVWQAKDPYFLFAEAIPPDRDRDGIGLHPGALERDLRVRPRAGRGRRALHGQRLLLVRALPADARRALISASNAVTHGRRSGQIPTPGLDAPRTQTVR
jgi:hypothetical protein